MGIKGLYKLISEFAPEAISRRKWGDYSGGAIVIDATFWLYKWYIAGIDANIRNSDGKLIGHLLGVLFRVAKMLKWDILPIFVFDGKAPPEKATTIARRAVIRAKKPERDVPREVKKECIELLDLLKIPHLRAPSEAEAQAAAMTLIAGSRPILAVMTDDSDALMFGARATLRMAPNDNLVEINLKTVLKTLKITSGQFIDLCIILGTEYAPKLAKVGPKSALKLLTKYKKIENFPINDDTKQVYLNLRKNIIGHKVDKVNITVTSLPKFSKEDREKISTFATNLGISGAKLANLEEIFAHR